MNTDIIVHPKLHHYGLTTANLDAMVEWYRKVLGMTVNFRLSTPRGAPNVPAFSAAFVSNDEVHHRMVFFEVISMTTSGTVPSFQTR
jgi:catechol 2,3-dioxygenase